MFIIFVLNMNFVFSHFVCTPRGLLLRRSTLSSLILRPNLDMVASKHLLTRLPSWAPSRKTASARRLLPPPPQLHRSLKYSLRINDILKILVFFYVSSLIIIHAGLYNVTKILSTFEELIY